MWDADTPGLGPWFALLAITLTACSPSDRESEELIKPRQEQVEVGVAPLPPEGEAAPRLTWTGCDISRKAYITAALAAYREQTGREVSATGGGATRGIRATVGGTSDVGGACRHTLPDQFPEEEAAAKLTVVGWDALVFFTSEGNPVKGLSEEQAKGILLGEIDNWKELGGPDRAIVPVFRQQTVSGKLSGVGYMTRLLLFGDPDTTYTAKAIFFVSSGPVEEYVESTPFSIAVTGISSAAKRRVQLLALDGVEPTKENIASGSYPLFRPLYLVTKGEPEGPAKDFVDWMLSEAGQATVSGKGAVNLEEGAQLHGLYQHWPEKGVLRN